MKRLRVDTLSLSNPLTPSSCLVSLGSCFSEEMARRIALVGLPVCNNPWGTTYNPASIASMIRKATSSDEYTVEDLLSGNGLWFTAHHDTRVEGESPAALLPQANGTLATVRPFLAQATHVILTLGTAVVYSRAGTIVSNCHKLPHALFTRKVLSVDECAAELVSAIDEIRKVRPEMTVIVTLSPIRHTPHQLQENSLSKAILRVAIDEAARHCEFDYFPAFEIAQDELERPVDFARDAIHLAPWGIGKIWRRFREAAFSDELVAIRNEIVAIRKALRHRPRAPKSEATQAHLARIRERLKRLQESYPGLDFSRPDQALWEKSGPESLRGKGIDGAGVEQPTPTKFAWTKN